MLKLSLGEKIEELFFSCMILEDKSKLILMRKDISYCISMSYFCISLVYVFNKTFTCSNKIVVQYRYIQKEYYLFYWFNMNPIK
jgi:hypothetical protein